MRHLVAVSLLLAVAAAVGCGGAKDRAADQGTAAATTSVGGVLATSKYDSGPRAVDTPADEALAEKGESLFQTKGCSACHTFGKRSTGPDLAGVTQRRTTAWMENQILHPDVMTKEDPISHRLMGEFALQMPNQGLTPDEAKAVIEYFKHKDQEAGH